MNSDSESNLCEILSLTRFHIWIEPGPVLIWRFSAQRYEHLTRSSVFAVLKIHLSLLHREKDKVKVVAG